VFHTGYTEFISVNITLASLAILDLFLIFFLDGYLIQFFGKSDHEIIFGRWNLSLYMPFERPNEVI
jgi:hypothetical protein